MWLLQDQLQTTMRRNVFLFTISVLCCISYCMDTPFVHLLGYKLIVDVKDSISTTDPLYCAKVCSVGNCTGFRMSTKTCDLFQVVQAAVIQKDECSYFIKNASKVIVANRAVDDIQQLVQNAVYDGQRKCPTGFFDVLKCFNNTVTKQFCEDYDSFLGFWWDDKNNWCRAPVMNVTHECPDTTFTALRMNELSYIYCYKIIPKGPISINDEDVYTKAENYCKQQINGSLISIHSDGNNGWLNDQQKKLPNPNGVMIGLKTDSNQLNAVSELYWSDGSKKDYSQFATGLKFPSKFTITMMTSNGKWTTDQSSLASFSYIACRTWATAHLMERAPGV